MIKYHLITITYSLTLTLAAVLSGCHSLETTILQKNTAATSADEKLNSPADLLPSAGQKGTAESAAKDPKPCALPSFQTADSTAIPVKVEDLIDGKPGSYHLVYAQTWSNSTKYTNDKTSADPITTSVSVSLKFSAQTDPLKPSPVKNLECLYLDEDPSASSRGSFPVNLIISRKDGTLVTKVTARFEVHGKLLNQSDTIEIDSAPASYASLAALRDAKIRNHQKFELFRISPVSFEIRESLTQPSGTTGNEIYSVLSRSIYRFSNP